MVIDIKMCRFDNVPWGFRLVGGSDFELPLTVVKVNEGSIAEEAGLKVGDVIVRINDTAATPLVHDEANKIITHCGNVFYFGVHREGPEPEDESKQFPIIGDERVPTPEPFLDTTNSINNSNRKSPLIYVGSEEYVHEDEDEYFPELPDRPCSVMSENTEIKLVEEEIAAVLSGETEVLKEHAVLGIFPKPGVCMTSDVLKTLNEEAIKTKAEKDKENKKWTTFLQKPNRPVPKSPAQIEAERRKANAYKVKIVKSEPRTPERSVSPCPQKPAQLEPEPEPEPEPVKEPTPELEIEEPPLADSEVPNLEEALSSSTEANNEDEKQMKEGPLDAATADLDEKCDKEMGASTENKETLEDNIQTEADNEEKTNNVAEAIEPAEPVKTEEELALERQLADVQKQLAALAGLPSTIQATLDAVTKQLADLLPTIKLQSQKQATEAAPKISLEKIDEVQEQETTAKEDVAVINEVQEAMQEPFEKPMQEPSEWNDREVESYDPVKKHDAMIEKAETRQMEEEQDMKKQKIELWNRLFTGENISRKIFREFHSACVVKQLQKQRVNFMKYQKPERKIDLDRSEVYKVIHHLDRQPVRGIEIRPAVVAAEVDIRKAVPS